MVILRLCVVRMHFVRGRAYEILAGCKFRICIIKLENFRKKSNENSVSKKGGFSIKNLLLLEQATFSTFFLHIFSQNLAVLIKKQINLLLRTNNYVDTSISYDLVVRNKIIRYRSI